MQLPAQQIPYEAKRGVPVQSFHNEALPGAEHSALPPVADLQDSAGHGARHVLQHYGIFQLACHQIQEEVARKIFEFLCVCRPVPQVSLELGPEGLERPFFMRKGPFQTRPAGVNPVILGYHFLYAIAMPKK